MLGPAADHAHHIRRCGVLVGCGCQHSQDSQASPGWHFDGAADQIKRHKRCIAIAPLQQNSVRCRRSRQQKRWTSAALQGQSRGPVSWFKQSCGIAPQGEPELPLRKVRPRFESMPYARAATFSETVRMSPVAEGGSATASSDMMVFAIVSRDCHRTSRIGYCANISSTRSNAFSAAVCGVIPPCIMSVQPVPQTCSVWTCE
jgi:hypothetical protein